MLAGSMEAREIAARLMAQGQEVVAVKSEAPRGPDPMPMPWKLIDTPGEADLRAAMAGALAVVDASHGFDAAMSRAGHAAARALGLPYLSLSRPAWGLEAENWQTAADVAAAMPLIPPGSRVFSATGWGSLPDYAAFPGARLMLRQTQRHDRKPPFDFVELVFGDPPFSVANETALFRARAVDLLICRNLGGRASRPKLEAALALGIGVILIDRPPLPDGTAVVHGVEEVLDWVAAL